MSSKTRKGVMLNKFFYHSGYFYLGTLQNSCNRTLEIDLICGSSKSLSGRFRFFCLKISGPCWGPKNVICCSVNVDGVFALLQGNVDTSTPHDVIKLF